MIPQGTLYGAHFVKTLAGVTSPSSALVRLRKGIGMVWKRGRTYLLPERNVRNNNGFTGRKWTYVLGTRWRYRRRDITARKTKTPPMALTLPLPLPPWSYAISAKGLGGAGWAALFVLIFNLFGCLFKYLFTHVCKSIYS